MVLFIIKFKRKAIIAIARILFFIFEGEKLNKKMKYLQTHIKQ